MRFTIAMILLAACARSEAPVIATIHDHTHAAGTRSGDTVQVTLRPVRAMWYPETTEHPGAEVWALAADGATPMIPGPLLRGGSTTVFRVRIENPSRDSTLLAFGFGTRPGAADTVRVAPRRDTTVTFLAGDPGTYFYYMSWGVGSDDTTPPDEALLAGALIVDPLSGPTPDRIFLTSSWLVPVDSAVGAPFVPRDWMVINGRSFPYNGTIEMEQGDTAHWRWINASHDSHPIHLHGDHFRVTRRGNMLQDNAHWKQEVVTELIEPGETFAAEYVPTEPGNWLLHCHFAFHTSHFLSTERVAEPHDPGAPGVVDHSVHGMKGMLIGIRVRPREGAARRVGEVPTARRIRIIAQGRDSVYRGIEGMAFIPVVGNDPAPDSLPIPSPTLVLQRGEPVAITVVNRMRAPTAVHWHGLELPSWSDGVPGLSGGLPNVAAVIAPGDSFTAHFAPPRAGTFMYHAHSNELHQIGGGLYGALLVVDPATYRPDRERVVVIGGDGFFSPGARVNGSLTPAPIEIPADTPIRFRMVDIQVDFRVVVQLLRDSVPVEWTSLAKDGADLPSEHRQLSTDEWLSGPGETADYEVRLPRGEYTLMVRHLFNDWAVPVRINSR